MKEPFLTLPRPLSLEEIRAHTPQIRPLAESGRAPLWSVMIPTYNSDRYLRRTLQSVLAQARAPEDMQIEVVDGGSTIGDSRAIVDQAGQGRIAFHRLDANRGSSHTFNVCIERSRGSWVHIIHGDDMILPGFYDVYDEIIRAHPEARTIVGQSIKVDEADRWTGLYGPEPPVGGGVMPDFVERQAVRQLILFPSVAVRRDAYEQVGGFCTLLNHVGDWDMWFRLGQAGPVAWTARPHTLYRVHAESDTSLQRTSASNMRECYFVVTANLARLNGRAPSALEMRWQSGLAAYADTVARQLALQNCTEGRYRQARWAWMLEPTAERLFMLVKSWIKHVLRDQRLLRRSAPVRTEPASTP